MPLRRPTWLLVLVVLCGILAGLPAGPARGAAAPATALGPAPDPAFGIDGAMRWPAWGTFAQPAAVARQAGAGWVREDFAWGLIEPRPGQFAWEATDRLVDALQAQGLQILGILSYSAAWAVPGAGAGARGISFQAPDLGQYRAFVQTLVARYRGRVAAWEVWNEPNSALFWQPAPDPVAYATVLQTAYGAVKAADPAAQVLTGGMSGNAVPFLEAMLAAGAANSFDILALHPYAIPVDPAQGRAQSSPDTHKLATVELPKYRALLARHGLTRPIWVTEIGWPAADWQLDPGMQAAYLTQAYALLLGGGIADKVFWYSFKDEGAAAGQSWGLLGWGNGSQDLGAARPAFAAYQAAARILSGAQPLPAAPPAGAQTLDAFEAPAAWHRTYGPVGSLEISGDTSHGGAQAGKLAYQFSAPNQAVDVAPPAPIAVPGRPARLGLWVRGDSSGNYLSVWLRDAAGALFKLRLGAMDAGGAGWQYLDAPLDGYFFPWEVAGGGGAAPQFPVSVVALRLENTPDEPAGSGVVYLDDLTVSPGPAVDDVRFARPGGDVVDVVWADTPVAVAVAPGTTIRDRDGNPGGTPGLPRVTIGPDPLYLIHPAGPAPYAAAPAPAPGSPAGCPPVGRAAGSGPAYFPQTGHTIAPHFAAYWAAHGGLAIFGYPISEAFAAPAADGGVYEMQWFERARFEWHPDAPGDGVLLARLGADPAARLGSAPAARLPGAVWVPETSHNLATFAQWWTAHGGVPVFGYPLTEEHPEVSPTDGQTYTVQYFERNRLEAHPAAGGGPPAVTLGLLGAESLRQAGCLP